QLEVGLVKLIEMRRVVPLNNLIERLNALEESLRTGVAPAASKIPPAASGGGGSKKSSSGASGGYTGSSTSRAGGSTKTEGLDVAAYMQPSSDEVPFGGVGGTTQSPAPVLKLVPAQSAQATVSAVTSTAAAAQPAFERAHEEEKTSPTAATMPSGSTIERIKDALEKRNRMFLVVALEGARASAIEGDQLYVEFAPEAKYLCDTLSKAENIKMLRDIGRELFGHDIKVRIVTKEKGEQNLTPAKENEGQLERERLREIAEQHPHVQQALRTFRAQIVDVWREESGQ
ncbi:MAG TPA: hypothetical protein VKB86_05880, partial [Pyrinomonadaceae bacterium]|nr:hypothetical protein [Pyrinomonadaceae bacterium]